VIASRSFATAAAADPGDAAFGRTSVYARAGFGVDAVEPVPAAAFLPPPSHASALVRLSRRPGSRARRALADALSRRAHERVRDLAARLRVDRSALGVRPQARLQSLTNGEVARLAAALEERLR
jgi:16S rRNA A1518/A1519 N6-dimethyltransferase RsmA/KsgA/DIM1 with predicted DNA glycosylase/AP lyase activity